MRCRERLALFTALGLMAVGLAACKLTPASVPTLTPAENLAHGTGAIAAARRLLDQQYNQPTRYVVSTDGSNASAFGPYCLFPKSSTSFFFYWYAGISSLDTRTGTVQQWLNFFTLPYLTGSAAWAATGLDRLDYFVGNGSRIWSDVGGQLAKLTGPDYFDPANCTIQKDLDPYYACGYEDGNYSWARFSHPKALLEASNGRLYVADTDNNAIRVLENYTVSTIAGGTLGSADGVGKAAQFNHPNYMCFDRAGNILIADSGNHRIRRMTPTGVVTTVAGSTAGYQDGPASLAKFNNPTSVAVLQSGAIVVTDQGNLRVRLVAPTGNVSTIAGNGSAGYKDGDGLAAQFGDRSPYTLTSVIVDDQDKIYVCDSYRIRVIAKAGNPLKLSIDPPYFSPLGPSDTHTSTVSITADHPWKLSVAGQGLVATGSASTVLHWDGKLKNGTQLPEDKYQLQLEDDGQGSGGTPVQGDITIDNTPPDMEISVDGKGENQVADSIIPTFKLKLTDNLSKFDGRQNVAKWTFSTRTDGVSVQYDDKNGTYDSEKDELTYPVPFDENRVLYPGDQWIEVTIKDRAGNKTTKRFAFAVGDHDDPRYSGVSVGDVGYRQSRFTNPDSDPTPPKFVPSPGIQDPSQIKTYPLPKEFDKPGSQKIRIKGVSFYRHFRPSGVTPNYYMWAVRGAAVGAAVTLVFFDEDLKDQLFLAIHNRNSFVIRTEHAGAIALTDETWKSIGRNAKRIAPTPDELASIVKQVNGSLDSFELWSSGQAVSVPLFGARFPKFLIVKVKDVLVCIHLLPDQFGFERINSVIVPAGDMTYQWSYVVKQIAVFEPGDNPRRIWEAKGLGLYPYWKAGTIPDTPKKEKTYHISPMSLHKRYPIVGAVPFYDRPIVATFP